MAGRLGALSFAPILPIFGLDPHLRGHGWLYLMHSFRVVKGHPWVDLREKRWDHCVGHGGHDLRHVCLARVARAIGHESRHRR